MCAEIDNAGYGWPLLNGWENPVEEVAKQVCHDMCNQSKKSGQAKKNKNPANGGAYAEKPLIKTSNFFLPES